MIKINNKKEVIRKNQIEILNYLLCYKKHNNNKYNNNKNNNNNFKSIFKMLN